MKKLIIAAALLGAMATQAPADPLDVQLKDRGTMVAAVALLVRVPDKCIVNHKARRVRRSRALLFRPVTRATIASWET